jgi:hypothetical protein
VEERLYKKTSLYSKFEFSFSVTLRLPFKELFFSVLGRENSNLLSFYKAVLPLGHLYFRDSRPYFSGAELRTDPGIGNLLLFANQEFNCLCHLC